MKSHNLDELKAQIALVEDEHTRNSLSERLETAITAKDEGAFDAIFSETDRAGKLNPPTPVAHPQKLHMPKK